MNNTITETVGTAPVADSQLSTNNSQLALVTERRAGGAIPFDTLLGNIRAAAYDERETKAVIWLHHHQHEEGLNLEVLAARLRKPSGKGGYAKHSLYRLFRGIREAGLENIITAIEKYREIVEKQGAARRAGFIETELTGKVWDACDVARANQRVFFIYGKTQRGKTRALQEYQAAHNHGLTHYVRVPEGGRMGAFIRRFAEVMRIPWKEGLDSAKERIIGAVTSQMVIIVDEVHQSFIGTQSNPHRILEYLRDLFDAKACGMVLCGTVALKTAMETSMHAGILSQMRERGMNRGGLLLPDVPSAKELGAIAAHYGLEPVKAESEAGRLQKEVVSEQSIGAWITVLTAAARVAVKRGVPLDWEQVVRAHATFEAMGKGK